MDKLNSATRELNAALQQLETALDALFEKSGEPGISRRELTAMIEDRAKLAEELDASIARERKLQALADEASEALGSAIAEIRAALNREEKA